MFNNFLANIFTTKNNFILNYVKNKLFIEYTNYLIIGIISNIISFIVFKILSFLNFGIDFAAIIGMLLGIFNTYVLSRIYMKPFIVQHSNKKLFIFITYYASSIYVISQLIVYFGSFPAIGYNIAWLVCNIIASFCNFLFISFVTLKIKA